MTTDAQGHRLEYFDQTAFEMMRATGRGQLMQCVWVYEHPVDFEGLRRFHRNFAESHGGRHIERSPLPFGRPRWVKPGRAPSEIQINETPRPRTELMDWADELAGLPIDPEHGPTWYLVVQPLTDGSTAISMVGSHVIGDGTAAGLAIFEAVTDTVRDAGYDRPGARTRRQALADDARQVLRDLPETRRALVKGAKLLWGKRKELAESRKARAGSQPDEQFVTVPSVAVIIDIPEWDSRAESLGGNSYSLLVGVTAKLAERLGRRRRSDGAVTLVIAINLRESLEDDRALAMAFANATVDPDKVTVDLTESRAVVREARQSAKNQTDPTMELFPLMPWLPKAAVKGVAELLFSYSEDLPVSCSNLGDLPPQIAQVDGTTAEVVILRALDQNVTLREMERSHGQLVVVSARVNGKVVISVEAYEIGAENSKQRLRELAEATLTDFGLTAVIE
ncbi:hypothetical protein ORI20_07950 [Mycobacterium sp. CVI_P3]|uniref:Diacylglycerol O-acyltransferase n=1 Tax=Mycobacterium pinniadriaticum TaxID=2994102 RepID=A0ABT3SB49_9MYCO|nr:hypothetical protein [Mycobacterium pinniadriaticum]MCX2930203.1 hypothetical protein [Mycobacterium pinniadriaticum]MCX2936735.1 hypothetical protein [Mycobacterium pinniadriaticum]